MDDATRRAIEWDCRDVLTRFINHLDARNHAALAALMAPEGAWLRPGGPAVGPAGVLKALESRPERATIRHVISNVVIDVIDETHATGVTYLSVYRYEGATDARAPVPLQGPYMVGESHNRLVRTPDGWRIQEKRTLRIFERDATNPGGKE